MADADKPAAPDALFKIFIAADIRRVWRELTKTDEAQGAVFNAWLHTSGLVPGAPIQMRTGSGKRVLVVGEVLVCDEPHRYAHTHRFTQHDDPVCEVHYELRPVGRGVEVTLRVVNLAAGTATAKSMASGGTMILNSLKSICETGRPPLGTRLMYLAFALLEGVLPARTKVEHWPLQKP
jgi:uncharacterized protein YndB with AHSA1/START domain